MAAPDHTTAADHAEDRIGHPNTSPQQSRMGQRFRSIFHRIRITSKSKRIPRKSTRNRSSQHLKNFLRPMQALRSRASWMSKPHESGDGDDPRQSDIASAPQEQPGFINRLLRRAQSKKTLKTASWQSKPDDYAAIPENGEPIDAEEATKTATEAKGEFDVSQEIPVRKPSKRGKKHHSLRSRFYSEPQPVTATEKKLEVYVPKHAGSDFSRVAVLPRDITARYHSLDEERRQVFSIAPPPPPRPDTSYSKRHPESRAEERHATDVTADTQSPPEYSSVAAVQDLEATNEVLVQPPSALLNAPRNSTRHSFRLAADPHEASEEESSDYQAFVQKAIDEDQAQRERLWRSMSQLSGSKQIVEHPDLNITLGEKDREKRASKRVSNSWKRASYTSNRSMYANKRQSYIFGGEPDHLVIEAPNRDMRRKTSMTKRISGYIKPERPDRVQGTY